MQLNRNQTVSGASSPLHPRAYATVTTLARLALAAGLVQACGNPNDETTLPLDSGSASASVSHAGSFTSAPTASTTPGVASSAPTGTASATHSVAMTASGAPTNGGPNQMPSATNGMPPMMSSNVPPMMSSNVPPMMSSAPPNPSVTPPNPTGSAMVPPGEPSACGISPVNPNASQQVKNLLCYLYDVYGNNLLSGQQETSWNPNPADDVNWINQQTGKYPAILGGDYLYPDGTTTRAKDWWNQGGLTMIRYHMGAPPKTDTYDNSKSSTNIDNVLMAGTQENTSFVSKLDYVARELQILEDANVPVIWAPFHEVQPNGWFWWAKGTGAQFIALWEYMYDYLTTTKGLDNLLWLMPFSGTPNAGYLPPKEYYDIAGPDTYDKGQPFASMYSQAKGIVGSTIPIPLHETGVIPDPNAMFPSAAPWLMFNIWAGYQKDTAQNSVANIKATYAHERTITRDEVPNLK